MTRSKRKLLISMLVAMFILMAAVAIVSLAFAATQQNISTTLSISYTAEDLDGSVSATYQIGTGTAKDLVPTVSNASYNDHISGNSLLFKADDESDSFGSLAIPETEKFSDLSTTNDYVLIKYTYSNTGAKTYVAGVTFAPTVDTQNMTISYSRDGSTWKTSEENYDAIVVKGLTDTLTESTNQYFIKIQIKNTAQNASLSGAFNWHLQGYDGTNEYESIDYIDFTVNTAGVCQASVGDLVDDVDKIVFPSEIIGNPVTAINQNSSLTPAQKSEITSVVIPDSVTTIDANAFSDYSNLRTVTFNQNEGVRATSLSDGLTTIGNQAFCNCTSLKSIELPSTLKNVSNLAFMGCTNLTTVSGNITTVSANAFNGCVRLSEFPFEKVTSIGANAFAGCASLTEVEFSNGFVGLTNGNEFTNCISLLSVKFPKSATKIDAHSFAGCAYLSRIEVDSANTEYISLNNCLIEKKSRTLVLGGCSSEIPTDGSVTQIGSYAFSGRYIQTVNIPDSVTSIGTSAFENCSLLTTVVVGNGVTSIGAQTFDCQNITSFTIGENVTEIYLSGNNFGASVTFVNPNGWSAYNSNSQTTTDLTGLDDATTAGTALQNAEVQKITRK